MEIDGHSLKGPCARMVKTSAPKDLEGLLPGQVYAIWVHGPWNLNPKP